ncbi:MAG: amphi-Trp domain-containing protein [Actinomycetia bacterium]|nr:amphi-Trp domain-containing protein [Actinomycetes bacterium]
MNRREETWFEMLRAAAKELGVDVPGQRRGWEDWVRSERAPQPEPSPTVESQRSRTRLVQTSRTRSREDAARFLEDLAGRMREGTITLPAGAYSVNLDIADELTVDLAASSHDGRIGPDSVLELAITMSWEPDLGTSDADAWDGMPDPTQDGGPDAAAGDDGGHDSDDDAGAYLGDDGDGSDDVWATMTDKPV